MACAKCIGGFIDVAPRKAGWRRVPKLDQAGGLLMAWRKKGSRKRVILLQEGASIRMRCRCNRSNKLANP